MISIMPLTASCTVGRSAFVRCSSAHPRPFWLRSLPLATLLLHHPFSQLPTQAYCPLATTVATTAAAAWPIRSFLALHDPSTRWGLQHPSGLTALCRLRAYDRGMEIIDGRVPGDIVTLIARLMVINAIGTPQIFILSLIPFPIPSVSPPTFLFHSFTPICRDLRDHGIGTTGACSCTTGACSCTTSSGQIPLASLSGILPSFPIYILLFSRRARTQRHLLSPVLICTEGCWIRVQAFLHLPFFLGACDFFPTLAMVGYFGAWRAGDVIEDCRLEASPEPGHGGGRMTWRR